jgi:allantoinase
VTSTPEPRRNAVDVATGRPALPGYDHTWFPWRPFSDRPPTTWPDGARTAVSIVLHLGACEWEEPGSPAPRPPGGRGIDVPPDVPRLSHREFGHRVGVFRLLWSLAELDIAPAAVLDVLTVEHYPALLEHLLPVAAEVLAGGLSASRPITSAMSEQEERDYVRSSLERLLAVVRGPVTGWLGPEHSESARTPALLAEAGLHYVADWANDDLPYPMLGAGSDLWAFPLSWELSDLSATYHRQVSPTRWAASVIEAFDVLHAEGGRMLALHLQPWLSGQAFRITAVEAALRHVREASGVWLAPPGAIVEHCREHSS